MPRILILSAAENAENIATNNGFVERLNAGLNGVCEVEWHNYRNIGLEMTEDSLRAFIASDGRDLSEFDAVYFKSYFRHHEQATAIAEALRHNNITFVGSELRSYIPAYKLTQMARLARGGVAIPHTVYLPLEHYVAQYDGLQAKLGDTFVFKAIDGSTGDDNYLVKSKEQLSEIIAANEGMHFIAQAFVPNDSDMRVLVVGGAIKLIIERRRADDSTHLNNTSQGAMADLVPLESLSDEIQALSLKAAQLMDRDIAGVDVMLEKGSGKPFILEVNASPQIASGAFEEEKLKIYTDFFAGLVKPEAGARG